VLSHAPDNAASQIHVARDTGTTGISLDALVPTYGMDVDELTDLMLGMRGLSQGDGSTVRRLRLGRDGLANGSWRLGV
jgi:hypothetical protein